MSVEHLAQFYIAWSELHLRPSPRASPPQVAACAVKSSNAPPAPERARMQVLQTYSQTEPQAASCDMRQVAMPRQLLKGAKCNNLERPPEVHLGIVLRQLPDGRGSTVYTATNTATPVPVWGISTPCVVLWRTTVVFYSVTASVSV